MKLRPCIDIHNGKVKQIVGSSLKDLNNNALENFVSAHSADYYAKLYKDNNLNGGHIILLNSHDSEYYEEDKKEAALALKTFVNGMQIGGGINATNASEFLEMGASHVIVTSFVFRNGTLDMDNLKSIVKAVSKRHLVLDLSCRKREDDYYIVTDRWQRFSDMKVNSQNLKMLSSYCDEFLVHAVDVEGKASGIDTELLELLSQCEYIPITYAGGVRNISDLETIKNTGHNAIDVTIGSALDMFGGNLSFREAVNFCR